MSESQGHSEAAFQQPLKANDEAMQKTLPLIAVCILSLQFGLNAAEPVKATIDDPAFQQWMKDVAAMPAQQQKEAVGKKLEDVLNTWRTSRRFERWLG